MQWAVSWERLIPPIGLSQRHRAVEQRTEIGFCEDHAFLPVLKNLPLLHEHDTLHFRWNFVNVMRHQQQRFPFSNMGTDEIQIVKRRRQIEIGRASCRERV